MNAQIVAQATGAIVESPILALVPLLPLLGAATLGSLIFSGGPGCHKISGWIAMTASAAAFICAVLLFNVLNGSNGAPDAIVFEFWRWFEVGNFNASFTLRFDRLASVMTLIITGVGSLIHLYAIGYMSHDDSRPRFFCYLNLFLFSMLLLVLGDNLLLMFVGWEGVGLCSYLLIGFWYKDMQNAVAGQKAFVVNRIGDAGFLLGIFTLFYATGSIAFADINSAIPLLTDSYVIEMAAFLLFIGAMGKSAQIPLFVWLPDAMAGPTPVSALIHAATMVTAGIYMIARLSPLYLAAPTTMAIVCCVGAVTALVAATIAIAQNDIKKVLAYSTVSQLGYMFMALGAGAFSNGIFHVTTHAFFKACLFMGAGSVIVGCHHEQDMRQYGGLRKYMPWTCLTYVVATLAIAGIPPLSGFYSKDAILWTVFSSESGPGQVMLTQTLPLSFVLWAVGLLTAALTAFYMTRTVMLTFFGEYRGHEHPHESPWTMVVPLLVLMVLSAGFSLMFGDALVRYLGAWTRPDMLVGHDALLENPTYHMLEVISKVVAFGGVGLAIVLYGKLPGVVKRVADLLPGLHRALLAKWWFDELFDRIIVRPLRSISSILFVVFDRNVIDAAVGGTGMFVLSNGELLRRMHTGRISTYALIMLIGTLCVLLFWILL